MAVVVAVNIQDLTPAFDPVQAADILVFMAGYLPVGVSSNSHTSN